MNGFQIIWWPWICSLSRQEIFKSGRNRIVQAVMKHKGQYITFYHSILKEVCVEYISQAVQWQWFFIWKPMDYRKYCIITFMLNGLQDCGIEDFCYSCNGFIVQVFPMNKNQMPTAYDTSYYWNDCGKHLSYCYDPSTQRISIY